MPRYRQFDSLLGAVFICIFVYVVLFSRTGTLATVRAIKSSPTPAPYECVLFRASTADCAKLFDGDLREQNRTRQVKKLQTPDDRFQRLAFDCDTFVPDRRYIIKQTCGQESEFS